MGGTRPIQRLLVANRSEIACRIIRTARAMGIETVAVYSDADRLAEHVHLADHAVALGGLDASESYLDVDKLLAAAASTTADAVHPGYGFLAENAAFAKRVGDAGLTFIGPSSECIEVMGDKIRSRKLAFDAKVPVIPAETIDGNGKSAKAADKLGYPVLIKAAAGGGGKGMRIVASAEELASSIASATREAESAFADGRVYLEKFIERPRHVEVQVFGDSTGRVVHLGDRECSIQRRHQKIIEESPCCSVTESVRGRMHEAAVELASALGYVGAGTVEFIVDPEENFYFLEMNTRLQVEHAVTEMVTSTDLVKWQIDVAAGEALPDPLPSPRGHSIECRIYAEDPANDFLPTSGAVVKVEHPVGPGIRVDSALRDGLEIPVQYDPMLAKIVSWGPDRPMALARMVSALAEFSLIGITTNLPFLIDVLEHESFGRGDVSTLTVAEHFGGWEPDDARAGRIAAIAAAILFDRGRGAGTPRAVGGGQTVSDSAYDPWSRLGAWRLGRKDGEE